MRSAAVDWLKAVSIIAVVLAHSGPSFFDRENFTAVDHFVRVKLVGFHVPVFLIVAGYLGASPTPLSWSTIVRRVTRVAVPFVAASLLLTAVGLAPWRDLPWNLLIGNARGVYYFVPLWIMGTVSGWLWSRMPHRLPATLAGLVVLSLARPLFAMDTVTWAIRDPLASGALVYYLLGWCARCFRWDRWIAAHRASIVLALALAVPWVAFAWLAHTTSVDFSYRLACRIGYAVAVAWAITAVVSRAPRPVVWLSTATLPIFLYHDPIVVGFSRLPAVLALPPLVRMALSVAVALAILVPAVLLATRLIPARIAALLLGVPSARSHADGAAVPGAVKAV